MSAPGVSKAAVEGCSGALGSVIALLATYPLKTIYTLQALSTESNVGTSKSEEPGSRVLAVLRFLQQYKLSTLYVGMGPNIVETALSNGVYFFFYSKLREMAGAWAAKASGGRSKDLGLLASLLVPAVAGAINQLVTMPASVVATRMQGYRSLPGGQGSGRPPTTLETIAAVFREGGVAAFWKGLLPSMILLANPAVQYMLYEKIKAMMLYWKTQRAARAVAAAAAATHRPQPQAPNGHRTSVDSDEALAVCAGRSPCGGSAVAGVSGAQPPGSSSSPPCVSPPSPSKAVELSAMEVFLAGALAKIGATVVTYPLIVVKARTQASAGGKGSAYRASTWGGVADTARREGLGGFYKGLRAKILQTALNAALMLMLKEQLHGATKAVLSMGAPATSVVVAAVKAPAAAG